MKQGCLLSTPLFHYCTGDPRDCNKMRRRRGIRKKGKRKGRGGRGRGKGKEKERRGEERKGKNGSEEFKVSLFVDDIISYQKSKGI